MKEWETEGEREEKERESEDEAEGTKQKTKQRGRGFLLRGFKKRRNAIDRTQLASGWRSHRYFNDIEGAIR